MQLEEKFYAIEEEWSEQVLQFLPYKTHGFILLVEDHTHFLVEQLEHAGMQLAMMLMSPHINHLREDAAQWAIKLARIGEVLQQVRETRYLSHASKLLLHGSQKLLFSSF